MARNPPALAGGIAGFRGIFVCFEGALDLGQLDWEILPPTPALGWTAPLWQAAGLLFPSGTRVTGPH